jgi:hypothetical protein
LAGRIEPPKAFVTAATVRCSIAAEPRGGTVPVVPWCAALLIASTFAPVTTPANADFELCNTTGWTITGNAFSVSSAATWWGGTYDQHGNCFLSGYLGNADTATGPPPPPRSPRPIS